MQQRHFVHKMGMGGSEFMGPDPQVQACVRRMQPGTGVQHRSRARVVVPELDCAHRYFSRKK